MQYSHVGDSENGSNITVFVEGKQPLVAHSTHPNFQKIVDGAIAKDESIVDLFDAAQTAVTKFERLSDRVTAAHGKLYVDGEELNDAVVGPIVRFLSEGVDDWKPLVNYIENVLANPQEDSRQQLYIWLSNNDITLTPEGHMVVYKGVYKVEDGIYKSVYSGTATVDGEVQTGQITQKNGSIVEMPRNEVHHDPSVHCSTGLHVGTYEYAKGWSHGALLEVHVNPRDVVSVPSDTNGAKVRVCRYRVVDVIDAPRTTVLTEDWSDDEDLVDFSGEDEPEEIIFGPVFHQSPDEPLAIKLNPENASHLTADEPEVAVGDKFEDQDKRRAGRVLVVVSVDGESVTVTGGTKIKLSRLLTPYRFKKV